MKYPLPPHLKKAVDSDAALKKIVHEGESRNHSYVKCLEAVVSMFLVQQKFLFVELGRYRSKFGDLPEMVEENQTLVDKIKGADIELN